jgi:hypothetical protein
MLRGGGEPDPAARQGLLLRAGLRGAQVAGTHPEHSASRVPLCFAPAIGFRHSGECVVWGADCDCSVRSYGSVAQARVLVLTLSMNV